MNIFYQYLVFINVISFLVMYIDKRKAIKHQWRISEKALIGISILGGSIGSLLGMYSFRHKTKHKKFTIGIPVILVVQFIAYSFFTTNTSLLFEEIYNILNFL